MPGELLSYQSPNSGGGIQTTGEAVSLIPASHKYSQNYRVHRVKLDPIDITEESAREVFKQIIGGAHAIVLGNHLVMCNSIMSIDPLPIKKKPRSGRIVGDLWIEDKPEAPCTR